MAPFEEANCFFQCENLKEVCSHREHLLAFLDRVEPTAKKLSSAMHVGSKHKGSSHSGWIYVLELRDDFVYVGHSMNPEERMQEHLLRGDRCPAWVLEHPATGKFLVPARPAEGENPRLEEDMVTKEWMDKCGIDNVRGGAYCQVKLTEQQKKALEGELWHGNGLCFKCKAPGHCAKDCGKKQ